MPKVLSLGKEKKNSFFFCFSLAYSYLWLTPKVLSLGKEKKNGFFFCFSLAYSYLCTRYSRGARKLWAEMIPYNLMRVIPT